MRSTSFIYAAAFATTAVLAAQNAFIPDGISTGCSTYLKQLNSDASVAQCTASLLTATKAYGTNSTVKVANSTTLTNALTNLCGANAGCSGTVVRSQLTNFYAACPNELTGSSANEVIRGVYDALYVFSPLQSAICSKDSATNKYCVLQILSGSGSGTGVSNAVSHAVSTGQDKLDLIAKYLASTITWEKVNKRAAVESASVLAPNSTTYTTTGLPYLFLTPDSTAEVLCTPCGKAIISSYVQWETKVPYSFGLTNSPLLGGQSALWQAMTTKCGADFMTAVASGAGAAPLGALGNGAAGLSASKVIAGLGLVIGGAVMSL